MPSLLLSWTNCEQTVKCWRFNTPWRSYDVTATSHYLNHWGLIFQHPSQWRHNELHGVSDHQPHDCLLDRLFRLRSKKTSTLRATGICDGNSPRHRWIPRIRASDAELCCFLWSAPEPTVEQAIETLVIWDAIELIITSWRSYDVTATSHYLNHWGLIFQHPSQWRHNELDGVPDHQLHDCLLNRLFMRRSKKTSKIRVTGLGEGNSPVTGEFPAQRASNAENVSIWWRHHFPNE